MAMLNYQRVSWNLCMAWCLSYFDWANSMNLAHSTKQKGWLTPQVHVSKPKSGMYQQKHPMKTYRETNHNLNYKDQASTILNIPKERSTDVSDVSDVFTTLRVVDHRFSWSSSPDELLKQLSQKDLTPLSAMLITTVSCRNRHRSAAPAGPGVDKSIRERRAGPSTWLMTTVDENQLYMAVGSHKPKCDTNCSNQGVTSSQ